MAEDDDHTGSAALLATLIRVLSAVDDYLFSWIVDAAGEAVTIFESRSLAALVGGEDGGSPLAGLRAAVVADDADELARLEDAIRASSPELIATFRCMTRDGSIHLIAIHAACAPDGNGGLRIDGIVKDGGLPEGEQDELTTMLAELSSVTAQLEEQNLLLDELHREAEQRSRIDALTGAFNRRHFMEALERETARGARDASSYGLILLDIDRFKAVNDTYGHPAGDAVLIEVAARLARAVREYDTVARYGGEEFVVHLPGIAGDDVLLERAERIRAAVGAADMLLPDGTTLRVTASCGAARWSEGTGPDALLDAADRALYAAKRSGRDRTRLFGTLTAEDVDAEEPEAMKLARGLALAASIREASPENHCEVVADLAAAIASQLALPNAMIMRCRLGGWLHDVGKLAIPDRVLHPAAPLSGADRELLHAHVELGADIVGRMSGLREAAGAVRHHHERWDGSGYPDGLAGETIPLEARIVAAADAYSAITAGRVYQPALPPEAAIALLVESAGRSLDPAVVAALAEVTSERSGPAHVAARRSGAR